jgi:hypothetical protein
VEALTIPPERLRALLIAEAELGERIMRALILRRMGLIETGAGGPVIVGRAGNGDGASARGLSAPQRPSASKARSWDLIRIARVADEPEYLIKSANEPHERVAFESELSRA